MQLWMGWENDGMMWRERERRKRKRKRRENRNQKKKERVYFPWYSLRHRHHYLYSSLAPSTYLIILALVAGS